MSEIKEYTPVIVDKASQLDRIIRVSNMWEKRYNDGDIPTTFYFHGRDLDHPNKMTPVMPVNPHSFYLLRLMRRTLTQDLDQLGAPEVATDILHKYEH